jgi:uncharacterized damage-inducible protein DinB
MTLQEKIKANTVGLLNSLNGLTDAQANVKPESTVWSVLECLEHVFLVDVGISKALLVETTENNTNDKSELIGYDKLNHILVNKRKDFKVPAPDFVSPTGRFNTIEQGKQSVNIVIDKILLHLNQHDISTETHTIKHPRLGEMTKLDWIYFLITHTNRHIEQMEELKKLL